MIFLLEKFGEKKLGINFALFLKAKINVLLFNSYKNEESYFISRRARNCSTRIMW